MFAEAETFVGDSTRTLTITGFRLFVGLLFCVGDTVLVVTLLSIEILEFNVEFMGMSVPSGIFRKRITCALLPSNILPFVNTGPPLFTDIPFFNSCFLFALSVGLRVTRSRW